MAQRTVIVKSSDEGPLRFEVNSDEALLPGMLVKYSSATSIAAADLEAAPAQSKEMKVVVESGTIAADGTYPAGDTVPFIVPRSGDELYMYATHIAGGTIPFNGTLVAADGGFLMDTGGTAIGDQAVLCLAMEAKSISANSIDQLKVLVL